MTPVANRPRTDRSAILPVAVLAGTGTLTPCPRCRPRLLRHPRRDGGPVGTSHARDPLAAAGNEFLPALRDTHVVEGETDLRLGQFLQAHPDGQLVEGGGFGQVLALRFDGKELQALAELVEHAGGVLEQEHLPAASLPAHVVDVVDIPDEVCLLKAHHMPVFVILFHFRPLLSGS
jgi:hypothetical protein